ncbi:hypothetical protein GGH13_003483 [Coemansia sp. S155-1]|nr:hypothetical protein GGH13_003483 [Coemansia sp. S155-1]
MRFSHFFFFVSLFFALVRSSAAHFAPAAAHLLASAALPSSCGTWQAAPTPVPTTQLMPAVQLGMPFDDVAAVTSAPTDYNASFLCGLVIALAAATALLLPAVRTHRSHIAPLKSVTSKTVETDVTATTAERTVPAATAVTDITSERAEPVETIETVETDVTATTAERAEPVAAAVTAEPGIVISDAVPDTEVHFVPATIEVGKAHAAACKTEACAKDLLKKVEATHCAIGTRDFDDVMYLAIVADLGLDIAAEEERNLARNAAQDIVAYCNSSVNRAELIADDAATIVDRIYMLSNCSWDDLENLALYEHAAILALHSARWRATAWEALTEEHAKCMAPGTAWLKCTTSSDRHIRFADD